jgi:hypothetical protein
MVPENRAEYCCTSSKQRGMMVPLNRTEYLRSQQRGILVRHISQLPEEQ